MNLEDIAALPSVAFADRLCLPECEAVYFVLADDGRLLYIGATAYLKSRMGSHKLLRAGSSIESARIAWRVCIWPHSLMLEADLIWQLQPPLNVRGKQTKLHPETYWHVRAALKMDPPDSTT